MIAAFSGPASTICPASLCGAVAEPDQALPQWTACLLHAAALSRCSTKG
jgi:hypothetical protein